MCAFPSAVITNSPSDGGRQGITNRNSRYYYSVGKGKRVLLVLAIEWPTIIIIHWRCYCFGKCIWQMEVTNGIVCEDHGAAVEGGI